MGRKGGSGLLPLGFDGRRTGQWDSLVKQVARRFRGTPDPDSGRPLGQTSILTHKAGRLRSSSVRPGNRQGGNMKTDAAILWPGASEWSVEEIELDPPKNPDEVLVSYTASGMCHSDEHVLTGDLPVGRPLVGGHEGAGIVEEVGPGCTELKPGDHVVMGFIPACGRCPSCTTGHSNLCDVGATLLSGRQTDGTSAITPRSRT